MKIDIIKQCVKKGLIDSNFLYINDTLEKTKTGWNLTYYVYGMTTETNFILFTKFSFLLDDTKKETKENKIVILYDLNCNYYVADFADEDELVKYIFNLAKSGYDNGDIRDLSTFLMTGTDEFNKILKEKGKTSFINDIKYNYDKKITNCNEMVFTFILSDATKENKIYLKKHNKNWILNYGDFKNEITHLKDVYSLVAEKLY